MHHWTVYLGLILLTSCASVDNQPQDDGQKVTVTGTRMSKAEVMAKGATVVKPLPGETTHDVIMRASGAPKYSSDESCRDILIDLIKRGIEITALSKHQIKIQAPDAKIKVHYDCAE